MYCRCSMKLLRNLFFGAFRNGTASISILADVSFTVVKVICKDTVCFENGDSISVADASNLNYWRSTSKLKILVEMIAYLFPV